MRASPTRAADALRHALARVAGDAARITVERIHHFSGGLSRDGFAAHVEVTPDPADLSDAYVALLANRDADRDYPDRVRNEARVLEWIAPRIRNLRVPRAIALLDAPSSPVLVETFVRGVTPDLRLGRLPIIPWEIVADAAAAVHAADLPPFLQACDRRQHRLDLLDELFPANDAIDILPPVLKDTRAWMRAHADRSGPGVLLHGDLLGQNLRIDPGEPLGVIDWEYAAIGDPAHDLAVVTRGGKQPFQAPDGRNKLLTAYAARSPHDVTRDDLRFFELALLVRWINASTPDRAEYLARLTKLVPKS